MKEIKNYNYQIDESGNVYSNKRGIILKQIPSNGYLHVRLYGNPVWFVGVHHLLGLAFIPNTIGDNAEINHKNGIRNDNRLENLEWVTHKENINHAYRTGLKIPKSGENATNAKLTNKEVKEIRAKYIPFKHGVYKLGKEYGVSYATIHYIISNKTFKNGKDN